MPSSPQRTAVLRDRVYAMPLLPSVQLGRREGAGEWSPVTGAEAGAVAEAEEAAEADEIAEVEEVTKAE